MRNIDPITMEVIKNALSSIADEMALVIMRTAYSSIVRDSMDYSTGMCDAEGRVVAHGLTCPLHLGSFPDAMQQMIGEYSGNMRPGDMFVFNDPYGGGGMHIPDVYIVKPIFLDGELEGYAATLVHQTDLGGLAPGSNAVHATEIYQEGLRIPIVKLFEEGRLNQTIDKVIAKNTRFPDKVRGDMRAQVAACLSAEKAYLQLLEKYGRSTLRSYTEEMHDYAEHLMRTEIEGIPDGVYTYRDYIDGLGDPPEAIVFDLAVTVKGGEIVVDWTGTSPQVKGAINCPVPFTKSAAYLAVKCLAEQEIPNFEGFTRPIQVIAPLGSIVNPRLPGACNARAIVGFRMLDALFGAFAQAVPARVPAAGEGGVSFPAIGGYHDDLPFVCTETLAGAWGAMPERDGVHGIPNPGGNMTNQPVEMIEALYPVEIERYALVDNSGGPGRFRGAPAFVRQYRLLGEEAVLTMRSDRRRHLPYGLAGGYPGTPSWNIINPGAEQRVLPAMPMEAIRLAKGDVFCHISAGGGGHGSPLEREPERVLEDVLEERLSTEYARHVYGVVIDPASMVVDPDATDQLRHEMSARAVTRPQPDPEYLRLFLEPLRVGPFRLSGARTLEFGPGAATR